MMLASGSAASLMIWAASDTSSSPMSSPPVTLMRTPRAPSIEVSSSGLLIAAWAARMARSSPLATPMPINADPASCMIVRTSAKSRLMSPGTVIRSAMPCTPCRRTSSARRKASTTVAARSMICSSRSLGMVINVLTFCLRLRAPSSAACDRRRPSKAKGLVTTPMVSAPSSRATSATMGDPPVPVPPPIPAVMNTMSAPSSTSKRSSLLSSAACRPISGSPPAPSPLVSLLPTWIFLSALLMASACASVLMAMNSTPRSPAEIIRFTALLPPPPTPTTLIAAYRRRSRSMCPITMAPLTAVSTLRRVAHHIRSWRVRLPAPSPAASHASCPESRRRW